MKAFRLFGLTNYQPTPRVKDAEEPCDDEVIQAIKSVPRHFSASTLVDLQGTCQLAMSLPNASGSITVAGASGTVIGQGMFLGNADTYCNVWAGMWAMLNSGPVVLQIQSADNDVSGQYTDPTSGWAAFPPGFSSGGLLTFNQSGGGPGGASGLGGGVLNAFASGYAVLSGALGAAAFSRPQVFARVNFLGAQSSGFFGNLMAGFISQFRSPGSGGGAFNQSGIIGPAGSTGPNAVFV